MPLTAFGVDDVLAVICGGTQSRAKGENEPGPVCANVPRVPGMPTNAIEPSVELLPRQTPEFVPVRSGLIGQVGSFAFLPLLGTEP